MNALRHSKNKEKLKDAEKDELQRRKEKEKPKAELNLEALEKTIESLRSKCALVENDLKLSEERMEVQSRFLLNLEKRLASACLSCRERDPELSSVSRDNNNMIEVKEMLLTQQKLLQSLTTQGPFITNADSDHKPGGSL